MISPRVEGSVIRCRVVPAVGDAAVGTGGGGFDGVCDEEEGQAGEGEDDQVAAGRFGWGVAGGGGVVGGWGVVVGRAGV